MILLALEASAGTESAALWNDGRLLDMRTWPGGRQHAKPLFDALRSLLKDAGMAPERIDTYAVGLGPGSFAGLRMAISCIHGMALPGSAAVHGLSSAETAAAEAARETGRDTVLVCGDGRRQRIWSGLFRMRDGLPALEGDFRLDPLASLPALVPAGGAACTPDWSALRLPLAAAASSAGACLVERDLSPSAVTLGELAMERIRRGIPSLPLSPLYLHPPVFVPPSFVETPPQETP